jgi:hypothetical protein
LVKALIKMPMKSQSAEGIMRSIATNPRSEAKQEALAWLAAQLRWERTLDRLRGVDDDTAVAQAA